MKRNTTMGYLLVGVLTAVGLIVPSTAQIYFEKRVTDEVAVLENPPSTVMAKVTTANAVPSSLQNAEYESDVEVTKVVDIAYAKGDRTTAYGSVVRITGKAFLAVYGSINISPGGSVDTGSQRIEKVGQPPTRLEISGLKQELYYAGKLWKASSDKERSYIFVTDSGITGVNVSIRDSPLKSKCLRDDKQEGDSTSPGETRTIVELPFKNTVDQVGSVTIQVQPGLDISKPAGSLLVAERPGDQVSFGVGNLMSGDAQPAVFAGDGSEIRFAGYAFQPISMRAPDGERLCFKKCKDGWVYLCGTGSLQGRDLGKSRTANSCLVLATSSDPVLREGGIRDLGRVAEEREYPLVTNRLAQFLKDPDPSVRRAAAESLGRIGRKQCLEALKSALAVEQDTLTKAFLVEALSLCGGSALLGIGSDSEVDKSEAAVIFLSGRDSWVDAILKSRVKQTENVTVTRLISMLDSSDSKGKMALVALLSALKASAAISPLRKVAETDPSSDVRIAAKAAADEIDRYGRGLLMRLAR